MGNGGPARCAWAGRPGAFLSNLPRRNRAILLVFPTNPTLSPTRVRQRARDWWLVPNLPTRSPASQPRSANGGFNVSREGRPKAFGRGPARRAPGRPGTGRTLPPGGLPNKPGRHFYGPGPASRAPREAGKLGDRGRSDGAGCLNHRSSDRFKGSLKRHTGFGPNHTGPGRTLPLLPGKIRPPGPGLQQKAFFPRGPGNHDPGLALGGRADEFSARAWCVPGFPPPGPAPARSGQPRGWAGRLRPKSSRPGPRASPVFELGEPSTAFTWWEKRSDSEVPADSFPGITGTRTSRGLAASSAAGPWADCNEGEGPTSNSGGASFLRRPAEARTQPTPPAETRPSTA